MTRDDIIRMVRECADEIRDERGRVIWETDIYGLEKFVDLIAPPQREWQGLTDEEYEATAEQYVTNCYFDTLKYARAIEAKLKAKNGF
jgi:hypothetical protein